MWWTTRSRMAGRVASRRRSGEDAHRGSLGSSSGEGPLDEGSMIDSKVRHRLIYRLAVRRDLCHRA